MLNLLKAGVVALALTGFAAAGTAPAAAATVFHSPGVTVKVSNGHGHGSWWWKQHHRHKVCHSYWRHHHKVTVCKVRYW